MQPCRFYANKRFFAKATLNPRQEKHQQFWYFILILDQLRCIQQRYLVFEINFIQAVRLPISTFNVIIFTYSVTQKSLVFFPFFHIVYFENDVKVQLTTFPYLFNVTTNSITINQQKTPKNNRVFCFRK